MPSVPVLLKVKVAPPVPEASITARAPTLNRTVGAGAGAAGELERASVDD